MTHEIIFIQPTCRSTPLSLYQNPYNINNELRQENARNSQE